MSIRKRTWTTGKSIEKTAWIVDHADAAGTRRLKTFSKKKEADAFAAMAKVEIREGVHVADSASATVKVAGDLWVSGAEKAGLERTTTEQYRQHVKRHDRGVGNGMANDRTDVMLVQLLLRAILHGGKAMPGTILKFERPAGETISISGGWDNASANYLKEWEKCYNIVRNEAQFFNTLASDYVEPITAFPGKVVPYAAGGQKIIALCRMSALIFGDVNYANLSFPDTGLPDLLAKELFYSPK